MSDSFHGQFDITMMRRRSSDVEFWFLFSIYYVSDIVNSGGACSTYKKVIESILAFGF
jgi:hypothetical protein